jgi:hypothetical protein
MKKILILLFILIKGVCNAQNTIPKPSSVTVFSPYPDVDLSVNISDIPDTALVFVNTIQITHKFLLPYLGAVDVRLITNQGDRKDLFRFKTTPTLGKDSSIVVKDSLYKHFVSAYITQNHPDMPKDFVVFNDIYPIRYRCYAANPMFDLLSPTNPKPASTLRYIVDGRLQEENYDLDRLQAMKIQEVKVFNAKTAQRFWGQKAHYGLVVIRTQQFPVSKHVFYTENIRVVAEKELKNGLWETIQDTILTDINAFNDYKKTVAKANLPIYMINKEGEIEWRNRKTINFYEVNSLVIKNDTVFVETFRKKEEKNSISNILANHKRFWDKDEELKLPLYIVDNQEITIDKLKEFKSKELDFIIKLEGCDAIQQYGKRAEFGVMIYRKKKTQ